MKTFLLVALLCPMVMLCQIKTSVFTLDLGRPTSGSMLSSDPTEKRLVIPTKTLLSFRLINGNPYKYNYVINHRMVDFFQGQAYNALDSIAKLRAVTGAGSGRGPASIPESDSTAGSYDMQAPRAIEILGNNADLANSLNLMPVEVSSEDDDMINVLRAARVLRERFAQLSVSIDEMVTSISAEDYLNTDEFVSGRNDFNTDYIQALVQITDLNREATRFTAIANRYQEIFEEISKSSTKIKSELTKMFALKLENYIHPIDFNGKNIDVVEVTVERYDKNNPAILPLKHPYNIWIRGGLKIDVSAGIFLTSLVDREFTTRDTIVVVDNVDTTRKLVYQKDKGNFDIGVGSMVNISLRGGSWVRPTLNFGALFTTTQKFQILSGVGLILGKEERIVLHTGLAGGSITEIAKNYKADNKTPYDLGASGTIPTDNKFKFSHFFGITYNFGKTKKQKPGTD